MLPVLLTAAALAQTPCTWETPELTSLSAEVTSLADGASPAVPFAIEVPARETGLAAKATLEPDGAIALDLADESVRVRARVATGTLALRATERLDLGGGISVEVGGALKVLGVESGGVRVATEIAGYTPVKPTSAVVSCAGLALVAPQATDPSNATHALVAGEHALRATPGGPPIGTLSSANLGFLAMIKVLETQGDQRRIQLESNGVRLVGWLPSASLRESGGGIGGLIGARGMGLLASSTTYTCEAGTLYARPSTGSIGPIGELKAGAVVRVFETEGETRQVRLANATWLRAGSGALVLQGSALERCKVSEEPAVAQGAGSGAAAAGTPGRISGEPLIIGALDRSHIDAVIKKHLSEVRKCYQSGLKDNPKLAGKVIVKFVISKDGAVTSAETKSSTLNDKDVEGCINERFLTFEFKKPDGGGIVIVSYPFVFAPG